MSNRGGLFSRAPLRSIGFELWYWLGYKLDVKPEHMGAVPIYPPTIYQDTPETQQTLARLVAENDELKADLVASNNQRAGYLHRCSDLQVENDNLRAEAVAYAQLITKEGLGKPKTGPGRSNAKKLTKREVALVHEYHRAGWTNADIARSLDVNPATISRTVRGLYHKGGK